jgi:hypothetical protein
MPMILRRLAIMLAPVVFAFLRRRWQRRRRSGPPA